MGHATVRIPRVAGRYDLAIGASHEAGTLLKSNSAGRADFGVGWLDETVRLNLYYRPAYRRYQASLGAFLEHGFGAGLHVAPVPAFALDLYGDGRIGDVDLALVMLAVTYRLQR
jgi:hypothetical protein